MTTLPEPAAAIRAWPGEVRRTVPAVAVLVLLVLVGGMQAGRRAGALSGALPTWLVGTGTPETPTSDEPTAAVTAPVDFTAAPQPVRVAAGKPATVPIAIAWRLHGWPVRPRAPDTRA